MVTGKRLIMRHAPHRGKMDQTAGTEGEAGSVVARNEGSMQDQADRAVTATSGRGTSASGTIVCDRCPKHTCVRRCNVYRRFASKFSNGLSIGLNYCSFFELPLILQLRTSRWGIACIEGWE